MSAREELMSGLYDLLNREYDQMLSIMLHGASTSYDIPAGKKHHNIHHQHSGDKLLVDEKKVSEAPPTLESKVSDMEEPIRNSTNDDMEEEEEDWDLNFSDTGDSMSKKLFGDKLQLPNLRTVPVKTIDDLDVDNIDEDEIDFDAIDNANEGISTLCGIKANPDDQGDDWGDDFDFVSDLTPSQFTQQLNNSKSPSAKRRSSTSSLKGIKHSSSSSSSSESSSGSSSSSKSSSSSSSSISDIVLRTPGSMERSLSFCSTSTSASINSAPGNTSKFPQRRQTVSQKPEIPVLPVAQMSQTTGFLSPIKCGNLKSPRDEYKHEDDELFEEFALIKSFLKRVDTLRKDGPSLANKSISDLSQCLFLKNGMPVWFDPDKPINKSSDITEAVYLWKQGVQLTLDADYSGAIEKYKKAISYLDENDPYSKETDLTILKAYILLDTSIACSRQENYYNQTEYLRQAESSLMNIPTETNERWTQLVSIFKATAWYALAMCFHKTNLLLALKYSIKHNQNVLYRRGTPTCWNSVAKGCCMAGALIYDMNKSLSMMCLRRAFEAAKLAHNDTLICLIMPFVESDSSALQKQELPGMSESSGLEDRSLMHTARTVAGLYSSESNEDGEDENWDVEFGIETNMEHFSLNDNMKSSSSNALHSRPSIPPQYKLTEKLLKPMPTVTNYLRTTHLYSIKTNEGHSSIPEQKFSEWLRTLTKRQYEKQYGGYKTISLFEAMENHQKRLKDKIYTENFLGEYIPLCGGLSNAGRYDECWKVIREIATVVKDYISPERTPLQRKLAFTTMLVVLWIGLDSWSITRRKVFYEVRDIMVELYPTTAEIFTDIELEGYAHAEVTGNTTEMELWEAEEMEIDPMQSFGELYIKTKNEPPAADQLFADCRMYILTCCLSNMCFMALGISPVSYNLNVCTQREPDFYGTVIDEVGDIADIADFNDTDGVAPELHSLRTRIAELYRIYPAIHNSNLVKSRAAFTLGVWELARRNNDRAEELLFEALYLMANNDTDTQNIVPPCTNIGLQTHMLYGNLLLRGSRYMYASACYESAIMMCRLQQRKEYFMIARHAAEAAHKNDDIDRCIAIYNELYVAYMDKGRTNEGVYVLLILLDIYKQIGDFGEAEKAIRDAYATLSIPPSSINGNMAGGNNNGQSSEGSSPMVTSLTGSQQSGSSTTLPLVSSGQAGTSSTSTSSFSTVNNSRSQALLDLEIKFCELFLSSQLYEKGFVLLSELWRREIPQRSKRDSIAMLAAEAFAERGLLREVMYFFSAMSKHEDPQQQQQQQQTPIQDTFGTTLNMTSTNTIMVSGGLMLKRAQVLIRAFQASGNYLEGFEFVEATIHSYESTGFPSTKTKADLYYTRGIFLHNIFKRGKSIGYPRKLKASAGFRKAFYNETYFPYCAKDCDLQTFYRNTDVLQEAIATYILAVDLYQMVSDELSIIKCRLSSTELILNYMITSKIELDSTKDTFSMGSDFGSSSNSNSSSSDDEGFGEGSCSLNKPLSFPYFETKAHNSSYRNRNGRFTVSIESLQEFLFSALESSLDNMCILWYIESLLNIAELRIIQNEIEGSMSYWKEAKNLFFLFFMDPPLLIVRKWPTTLLEPIVNMIMRLCRILLNYDGDFINNNLIVLDAGVLAQEDLAISRHRPIPSALFSFDLLATPTSILSGELSTDYEGFVSSDKDLIPEIGEKVYQKFAKTQELAATIAEAEYKRENSGIKGIIDEGGSYSPTSGVISSKGLFTRRETFVKKTTGISVKDLLMPDAIVKSVFYEDDNDTIGFAEEDLPSTSMEKGTKRRTRSLNDISGKLAEAFGDDKIDLRDDIDDENDLGNTKADRHSSSSSSSSPPPQSSSSSSSSSSFDERAGFDTPWYEEASQVMLGLMSYMGLKIKDMTSHGNVPRDQVRKSLMDIILTFIQCADAGRVKEDFLSRGLINFYKRKRMNSGTLEFTENTLYAINIDSTIIFYSPATKKSHYTRLENVYTSSQPISSPQPIPGLLSSAKPVVSTMMTTQAGKKVLKGAKSKDFIKIKLGLMLTEDYIVMKVPRKMTLGLLIADVCECYNENVFAQLTRRSERYSSGSSSSSGKKKPRLSVSSTSSATSGKKGKAAVATDAKSSTPQAPPLPPSTNLSNPNSPSNPIALTSTDIESTAAATAVASNAAGSSANSGSTGASDKGHSKHRHRKHHKHHKKEHSKHSDSGTVKLGYTSKNGIRYLSSTQDFKKHCLALEHNVADNNISSKSQQRQRQQSDPLKKRKVRGRDKTKLNPDDFTIAKLPKGAADNINYYNTAQCTLSSTEIVENAIDGDKLSAPGAGGDGERRLFLCRQQRQLRPNVTMSTRPLAVSMEVAVLMRKIVYGSFLEEGQMEENAAACRKCADEFSSVMHGAKDVIAGTSGKINPASPVIVVSSYALRGIPFELVFRENYVLRAASFSDIFYSQYAAKHAKKDIYLPKYVVFTYQSGKDKLMKYKEINRKKYLLKLVKYSLHVKETKPVLSYLTDSTQLFNTGYKKTFMMKYKMKSLKVFNLDKLASNNTNTDNDYLTICDEINFPDAFPVLVVTYPDIVNCSSTLINVIRKNPSVVIVAVPRTCFSKVMKVILQEHENCVRLSKENPYLRTQYGFFTHVFRNVIEKLSIPIPVFNPPIPVFSKMVK